VGINTKTEGQQSGLSFFFLTQLFYQSVALCRLRIYKVMLLSVQFKIEHLAADKNKKKIMGLMFTNEYLPILSQSYENRSEPFLLKARIMNFETVITDYCDT